MTDPRYGGDDLGEDLPVGNRSRNHGVYVALIVLVVLVVGTFVVRGLHSGSGPQARSHRSTSAVRPSVPDPSTSIDDRPPPAHYPSLPVALAERQICSRCHASRAPRLARSASRALGPTRDLIALTVGKRGVVVAALFADGAQLTAILTPHGHPIMPTRLGITPPIGVQTQRNGRETLIVIVSGRTDAVALLGRPAIQRWLAALHLP